jgi:hypothetical protein
VILALDLPRRARGVIVAVVLATLLAAPAAWAAETLGHATSSTFPAGGSASASAGRPGGAPGGGPGGRVGGGPGGGGFAPPGGGFTPSTSGGFAPPAAGNFAPPGSGGTGRTLSGNSIGAGAPGGFGTNTGSLTAAIRYAQQHGGGVIGVSSQSSAAAAIVSSNADIAGLGGFSGRESSVSATWIAQEVAAGRLRWVIVDGSQTGGGGLPGDTRTGSQAAMNIVASTCRKVTLSTGGTTMTMYDCQGRAAAILAAAKG